MRFRVRVKSCMGRVKIPQLKQQHALESRIRSMSNTAYMLELTKALKRLRPDSWKSAYPGGKEYEISSLPDNFSVIESGFFFTIDIEI